MNNKKEVDKKGVYYVLLLVLVGLLISGGFLYHYQEKKKELDLHKRVLIDRLAETIEEYKALKTENDSLSNVIRQEQDQMMSLMDSISYVTVSSREKLFDFQLAFDRLRKELTSLRLQVDSLSRMNDSLVVENQMMSSKTSELESEIARNAGLKVNALRVDAINEKWGEPNITSSNSRTDYLKVCFTVVKNIRAEKGKYPVYLRVINPDRTVMTDGNPENSIEVAGSRLFYTLQKTIDFQGELINECYSIIREDFMEGTYLIELYLEGQKQAATQILLD